MENMELHIERELRKKTVKMTRGMNAFVRGKSKLDSEDFSLIDTPVSQYSDGSRRTSHSSNPSTPLRSKSEETSKSTGSMNGGLHGVTHHGASAATSPSKKTDQTSGSETYDSPQEDSDADGLPSDPDVDSRATFKRAANLLCESLELQQAGGVVFLDAAFGFRPADESNSKDPIADLAMELADTSKADSPKADGLDRKVSVSFDSTVVSPEAFSKPSGGVKSKAHTHTLLSDKQRAKRRSAEVLAQSAFHTMEARSNIATFTPLDERVLEGFLKRYPQGKLWSFDGEDSLSSSEEDVWAKDLRRASATKQVRINRKRAEAKLLREHFPNGMAPIFPSYPSYLIVLNSPTTAICSSVGFGRIKMVNRMLLFHGI